MMPRTGGLGLLFATLVSANMAFADLQNGNFESPSAPPGWFYTYGSGSALSGWHVGSGQVDLIGGDYWQPASGFQSLDMNGYMPGEIYQDFTLGNTGSYLIKFELSANPDLDFRGDGLGTGIRNVQVDFGTPGSLIALGIYGVDADSRHINNMNYVTVTTPAIDVTGSVVYRLQFSSLMISGFGDTVIDNVRIEAVPEPCTLSLLALSLVGILTTRRRGAHKIYLHHPVAGV